MPAKMNLPTTPEPNEPSINSDAVERACEPDIENIETPPTHSLPKDEPHIPIKTQTPPPIRRSTRLKKPPECLTYNKIGSPS